VGSIFETNDTLQITSEQGFPAELDLEKHKANPFSHEDFEEKIFEFKNKPKTRMYHKPPVRNFFAHNTGDEWIYWGQIEIIEVTLDYVNDTTSGKYRITKIFSPEEIETASQFLDGGKA